MPCCSFSLDFKYDGTEESLEEMLVFADVDVREVTLEDGNAEVITEATAFGNAKSVLEENGITDFDYAQVVFISNDEITLEGEDLTKFQELLDMLDDCEDVQEVYHNIAL